MCMKVREEGRKKKEKKGRREKKMTWGGYIGWVIVLVNENTHQIRAVMTCG